MNGNDRRQTRVLLRAHFIAGLHAHCDRANKPHTFVINRGWASLNNRVQSSNFRCCPQLSASLLWWWGSLVHPPTQSLCRPIHRRTSVGFDRRGDLPPSSKPRLVFVALGMRTHRVWSLVALAAVARLAGAIPDPQCALANEGSPITVTCPTGALIAAVDVAVSAAVENVSRAQQLSVSVALDRRAKPSGLCDRHRSYCNAL